MPWCADSNDPQPLDVPARVLDKLAIAKAYLDSERLLPPAWTICASLSSDGTWLVDCRAHPPYLNSPIRLVLADDRVARKKFTDANDPVSPWE